MRYILIVWLISIFSFSQTMVIKYNKQWQLTVDGQPFRVKGVTFGYDKEIANYDTYFKDLKFLGVNTIRTWATDKHTPQLLDAAYKNDIKVMVGIWMRHGRPGMEDDDSFDYLNDTKGMEIMYDNAIETVEKFKTHPAVLTWGIGNEVYLNTATDEEKLAYSKLLERICSKIKTIDSNHPITSVEAWTFGLDWWQKYVPSLDIYGLNSYGSGAGLLQTQLDRLGIDKPYIVTEFGVTGEWDIKTKKNDIKIEPTDEEKYNAIANGYKDWIANKSKCLGAYIFHYSNGSDFGGVWLMTHFKKSLRPQYWAIREAFTNKKPINNVPKIETLTLPDSVFKSGTWIPVNLKVFDIENENLEVSFSYNQRTGSRRRRSQINQLNHRGTIENGFEIELPKVNGAIKVYANVKDTYNNLGIASTSIIVNDKAAKQKKYLVPKVELPFYVYKDAEDQPYFASGYMGNYKAMVIDTDYRADKHSGNSAIKIDYNEVHSWYGIAFVDPANDWGDILGGYDISNAKTFSFWAKANTNKVYATIGFGMIGKDKPFPDTAKKSIEIELTKTWKKYTIKIKRLDLSCIRSGLVLFSSGRGFKHSIFIDDVMFE